MRIILFSCLLLLACNENDETQLTKGSAYIRTVAENISNKSFDPSSFFRLSYAYAKGEEA